MLHFLLLFLFRAFFHCLDSVHLLPISLPSLLCFSLLVLHIHASFSCYLAVFVYCNLFFLVDLFLDFLFISNVNLPSSLPALFTFVSLLDFFLILPVPASPWALCFWFYITNRFSSAVCVCIRIIFCSCTQAWNWFSENWNKTVFQTLILLISHFPQSQLPCLSRCLGIQGSRIETCVATCLIRMWRDWKRTDFIVILQ